MTTADGEIRGLSYQATPGMLVYRRSIAKDVLGTDDPAAVGEAVADWDKFYETAGKMKAGGYYMYSGWADTYRVYSNNVSAPWVDGNTVVVDQNMMSWVDRSMKDIQDGISHNVPGQWIDEWNKDMGPDSKVFCFFLPTDAALDWAVCPSPQGFYWGGTWLIACNGTDNAAQIKDIMLKMTADREVLRSLAVNNGEMSNDQPLMKELAQSPDFGIAMLGGQNYIGVLSDAAASISLPNLIMASAFAMLFFALFSNAGPVNNILISLGVVGEAIRFMEFTLGARTLVALMNYNGPRDSDHGWQKDREHGRISESKERGSKPWHE